MIPQRIYCFEYQHPNGGVYIGHTRASDFADAGRSLPIGHRLLGEVVSEGEMIDGQWAFFSENGVEVIPKYGGVNEP